nr:xanthine dehydrogenase family protein molybdopterin-binding subunit [Alphaproteobacteria bacterium]
MGQFAFGQAVKRAEDAAVLHGTERYSGDVVVPGMKHAIMVRSLHAHAEIVSIDTAAASAMEGVHAVLTHRDVEEEGLGQIPNMKDYRMVGNTQSVRPYRPILASGRVRYVGEPVAVVVADTIEQALDAAEAVDIDYDTLYAVATLDTASPDDRPIGDRPAPFLPESSDPITAERRPQPETAIWADAPDNIAFRWATGDFDHVQQAFQTAHRTFELALDNNRIIINPMENRSAIADYDATAERYTLTTPSQGVHFLRNQLANAIFHLPKEKIRVITPAVGGSFGPRIFLYNEQALVMLAAKRTGFCVKWQGTRSEGFVSDYAGRSHRTRVAVALDDANNVTAIRSFIKAELGAYISNMGMHIPTECSARMLSGVYQFPRQYIEVHGVFTNTTPVDAYRGAGRPEMTYTIERMMDYVAGQLGIDRIDFRLQHYIPPAAMPFRTPLGITYDSGHFADIARRALAKAEWAQFDNRRAASKARGNLRGIGFASYIEAPIPGGVEATTLDVTSDGTVLVRTGTHDNGQGHITSLQQIVASQLEIDIARIRVVLGDSDEIATGSGTGGSRFLAICGAATHHATIELIARGKEIVARAFQTAPDAVDFAEGVFSAQGTNQTMTFPELASHAKATEQEFSAYFNNDDTGITCPNGAHICEVEIDPETGVVSVVRYTVVDDFGNIMNPPIVRGQVHGGTAQGIG